MNIEPQIDLLERALDPWRDTIGDEYPGYRNHVYRIAHFCFALLGEPTEEERRKVLIAGAFHDIGIWIEDTVDYLDPSVPPALDYLYRNGLAAWSDEVEAMIREHHKVRPYRGPYPLVEVFRRGDLADFSLGLLRSGIPKRYVEEVKSASRTRDSTPLSFGTSLSGSLNPLPMMKWRRVARRGRSPATRPAAAHRRRAVRSCLAQPSYTLRVESPPLGYQAVSCNQEQEAQVHLVFCFESEAGPAKTASDAAPEFGISSWRDRTVIDQKRK